MPALRCPLVVITAAGPATNWPNLSWETRSNAPKCRKWIRLDVGKTEEILIKRQQNSKSFYMMIFFFFVAWGVAHPWGFSVSSNTSLAMSGLRVITSCLSEPYYICFGYILLQNRKYWQILYALPCLGVRSTMQTPFTLHSEQPLE